MGKACSIRRLALTGALSMAFAAGAQAQNNAGAANMTFFVTSVGSGKGADLGGLEGADRHCQTLAQAAGATGKTWRAYLSTQAAGGSPAVNAKDRIGRGPWQNAKGTVIAKDVAELHGSNNITKQTALTEKGEVVKGRGDTPNEHDVLTGSEIGPRAARMASRWSAITTGPGWTKARRPNHGTRPTPREADAARTR
jgi:hypothetical protein